MTKREEAVARLVEAGEEMASALDAGYIDGCPVCGEDDAHDVTCEIGMWRSALAAVEAAPPERDEGEMRSALSDLAMAYAIDGHMGVPDLPGWFDALAKQAKDPHAEQENRHLARVFRAYLATWGKPQDESAEPDGTLHDRGGVPASGRLLTSTPVRAPAPAEPRRDGGPDARWACEDCGTREGHADGTPCPGPLPAKPDETRAEEPTIGEVRGVVGMYDIAWRGEQRNCLNARLARALLRRMEAERAPAPPAAPGGVSLGQVNRDAYEKELARTVLDGRRDFFDNAWEAAAQAVLAARGTGDGRLRRCAEDAINSLIDEGQEGTAAALRAALDATPAEREDGELDEP